MQFDLTLGWYHHKWRAIYFLLLPFSWLFYVVVAARRYFYRLGWMKTYYVPVPVIVVGNLTVGGTGKTPLVIEIARLLLEHGYRPGIVSKGIGGRRHRKPHWVQANDSVKEVGDEAILLIKNTDCPLVIGVDRVAAVEHLLKQTSCNIVISDDGLQHYRLGRQIEIAVIDGLRYFGNQQMLPAGPLREPLSRIHQVDYVVINSNEHADIWEQELKNSLPVFNMQVEPIELVSLQNGHIKNNLLNFQNKKIHAVAAIGHPERFFRMLRKYSFDIIPHRFPDHYHYQSSDLNFTDSYPVVMTEKDAVKCSFVKDERYWYLKVAVKIEKQFQENLLIQISKVSNVC
ncbi:MAG: tetraacyldisaccharide 4'-kinase [Gammaproteobacteria bacterium RIFCSPHIGHO2_12_FULL_37_14]|nr:MAG: tetraacyldisaccharide 4'-kinase [Gammaproteobacteria bacterium RIFCSPHIGHO2_12_FULL_37_14]